jgi:hypothetical protein
MRLSAGAGAVALAAERESAQLVSSDGIGYAI